MRTIKLHYLWEILHKSFEHVMGEWTNISNFHSFKIIMDGIKLFLCLIEIKPKLAHSVPLRLNQFNSYLNTLKGPFYHLF